MKYNVIATATSPTRPTSAIQTAYAEHLLTQINTPIHMITKQA